MTRNQQGVAALAALTLATVALFAAAAVAPPGPVGWQPAAPPATRAAPPVTALAARAPAQPKADPAQALPKGKASPRGKKRDFYEPDWEAALAGVREFEKALGPRDDFEKLFKAEMKKYEKPPLPLDQQVAKGGRYRIAGVVQQITKASNGKVALVKLYTGKDNVPATFVRASFLPTGTDATLVRGATLLLEAEVDRYDRYLSTVYVRNCMVLKVE